MKPSDAWRDGVADDYFERNRDMGQHGDPVGDLIKHMGLKPVSVLEVGCGNGWRLAKLHKEYGCRVSGIDPSAQAIVEGREAGLPGLKVGTADSLSYPGNSFDVVIVGFCMFLIDPSEWLTIVAETDRVLQMDGYLFVFDFVTGRPMMLKRHIPGGTEREQRTPAVLYDFSRLWLGHPFYFKRAETMKAVQFDEGGLLAIQGVVCLAKTMGQFLVGASPSQDEQKSHS